MCVAAVLSTTALAAVLSAPDDRAVSPRGRRPMLSETQVTQTRQARRPDPPPAAVPVARVARRERPAGVEIPAPSTRAQASGTAVTSALDVADPMAEPLPVPVEPAAAAAPALTDPPETTTDAPLPARPDAEAPPRGITQPEAEAPPRGINQPDAEASPLGIDQPATEPPLQVVRPATVSESPRAATPPGGLEPGTPAPPPTSASDTAERVEGTQRNWRTVRYVPDALPVPLAQLPCALPTQGTFPASAVGGDMPAPAFGAVPSAALPYRGVMTAADGTPRVGRINAIFALYHAADGGVPVWVDIKAVETSPTGEYLVWLGQPTPFPEDLFTSDSPPWLGIQPEGAAEQPRVRMMDTPCRRSAPDDPQPTLAGVAPPTPIPYRSVLYDSTGAPLVGHVSAIFAFYEEPDGGVPMWVEIQTVHTGAAGGYAVLLGSGTPLPTDLLASGASRWLGVQPNGHAEQPRVEFAATSAPR